MSNDMISVPRELLEAIAGGGYCKADVMQRLQSLIDQRCTCPSGDGSLRWPCPVHQAEATVAASFSDGIEAAAKLIERRMDEYVNEHGSYDHDTGYTEFPGNGEETVEEWLNLAEGIRAIKAPCHSAEPVGLYDLGDGKGLVPLYRHPPDQAPVVQKYDDTLLPFLALMRKELHANAGKGDRPGWLQMPADTCLLEIIYHFGKLQKAVKTGDGDGMSEYAADVANMCMMLLDICGALGLSAAAAQLRKS